MLKKLLLIFALIFNGNINNINVNQKQVKKASEVNDGNFYQEILNKEFRNAQNALLGGFSVQIKFEYSYFYNDDDIMIVTKLAPAGKLLYLFYSRGSVPITVSQEIDFYPYTAVNGGIINDPNYGPSLQALQRLANYEGYETLDFNNITFDYQFVSNTTTNARLNIGIDTLTSYYMDVRIQGNYNSFLVSTSSDMINTFGNRSEYGSVEIQWSPFNMEYAYKYLDYQIQQSTQENDQQNYQNGYDKGFQDGLISGDGIFTTPFTILKTLANGMGDILAVKIIGNITIGAIISVPILLVILRFILGLFR